MFEIRIVATLVEQDRAWKTGHEWALGTLVMLFLHLAAGYMGVFTL